ncbi:MAG: ABC transporter permease [Chloroflexi bacterium]|nr:ABC transporter permease [Chloroflexota bacterium]
MAETTASTRLWNLARGMLRTRELPLLLIIVVTIVIMANRNEYFLTTANFRAMFVGLTPTAIIAVGMVILLVSGGFDLSVGAVLALSGTICARLVLDGMEQPVAVFGVLLMGAGIGFINGLLVTKLKINPLVATLGTLSIARGIAQVLTEGVSISGLPATFGTTGSAQIANIPYMVLMMLVIVIIGDLALRHTRALRQAYYVGSNENSARLSGIPVDRVRIFTYMLTAFLAAFAGVLLASRLMAGTPTAAQGLELQVLAACVIGGASLTGGEGTVLGAFLGVVFISIVSNIMTMEAVSIFWQQAVTGFILITAVAFDMLVSRRNA